MEEEKTVTITEDQLKTLVAAASNQRAELCQPQAPSEERVLVMIALDVLRCVSNVWQPIENMPKVKTLVSTLRATCKEVL
jgi:hypothetical protein